jgi:hypothetical protein
MGDPTQCADRHPQNLSAASKKQKSNATEQGMQEEDPTMSNIATNIKPNVNRTVLPNPLDESSAPKLINAWNHQIGAKSLGTP